MGSWGSRPVLCLCRSPRLVFFNDTATTEIYTLSLHDALPIYATLDGRPALETGDVQRAVRALNRQALETLATPLGDRKSTRLNSSHANISYAVFCLKKKIPRNARLPSRRRGPSALPLKRPGHH